MQENKTKKVNEQLIKITQLKDALRNVKSLLTVFYKVYDKESLCNELRLYSNDPMGQLYLQIQENISEVEKKLEGI